MKRGRDESNATAAPATTAQDASSSASSSSPYALPFEVIYSITSRRSGSLEAERAAVLSRLLGSTAAVVATASSSSAAAAAATSSSTAVTAADVSTLLEDDLSVCLGGHTRELVYQQLLHSSEEGSLLRLLTVELLANDGRTLVLAAPQGSGGGASTSSPAATVAGAPLLMDVAGAEESEDAVAHPADLVLLRCQPRKPNVNGPAGEDSPSSSSSSAQWATHVEFVTYNTSLLTAQDVDLWKEAVEGSITVVVRWLAALLEQPPGLGQLAYLEAAASSVSASSTATPTATRTAVRRATEGWRRALQLPLLLRVKPEVMRGVDAITLDRLRRTITFALETILHVFLHVETAMRLPHLCQRLVYLFLSSPLFVDGASQVSVQLIATDAVATTRQSIAQTLQACVQMGLQYASAVAPLLADAAASTAELRRSAVQARNGYEVLLSRVSHVWLLHSATLKSKRAAGDPAGPEGVVCEVLETVAASGVLRQVVRWLQLEEDMRRAHDHVDSGRKGDTADAIAELLLPPTLRQLQEGRSLQERTVVEQLTALRRTYNPYLSHEILQFLKGTAVAAYAELYGSTAAAVRRITKLAEGAAELQNLGRLDGVTAVPVETVEAVGVRPGGLGDYALTEVQQHAAFGLPVRLNVQLQSGHQQHQLSMLEATLQATRFTTEPGSRQADASLFAYTAVQLNGKWIVFPLVLTQLVREQPAKSKGGGAKKQTTNAAHVVAHVLRDGDMLADFVAMSAATNESGHAQAWVIVGEESTVHRRTPRRRRAAAAAAALANSAASVPTERLLPTGTPALTYMDCLRRLHALAVTVRQCEAGTSERHRGGGGNAASSGAAGGPLDRPFDTNCATGLWTEHFMDGAVPMQRHVSALTGPVAALLSGGGSGGGAAGRQPNAAGAAAAVSLQTLLGAVNGVVRFSSAQVEALYSLTAGSGLTAGGSSTSNAYLSPPTRPGAGGSASGPKPVAVKVVDGCTGSGKTSILYASGLLRGKLHAAARQEQQRAVQARLKLRSVAAKRVTEALKSSPVGEVFATTPDARSGRNLLEEASLLSAEARRQYQQLNEGFLYCSTPFMLRPAAVTSTVPEAVEELLFRSGSNSKEVAATEDAVWTRGEVNSIATLLRESHERSLKAPLTAQLSAQLELYRATGLWSGHCRAAETVATPLLSLTMSARETADIMTSAATTVAAAASSTSPVKEMPEAPADTWDKFVARRFWPESAVTGSLRRITDPAAAPAADDEEEEAAQGSQLQWQVLATAPDDRFAPVSMPSTTRLSSLSVEQREGWHSVYLEKQADLAHHIHAAVHESVRAVFQFFLDLVYGVAATSQSTRHSLLTATPVELTQGMQLPYLWCWQPAHVCIDDLDAVQDGVFAMLTHASTVVYSLTAEVPAFQERRRSHERVVLALVRSLRSELQRVGALTTTALRESLRCRRAEVETVLRFSTQDSRALAKPLEGDAEDGAAAADTTAATAEAEEGQEEMEKEEARKTLDFAAPPPAFAGLASYSAVEVWSHGASLDHCVAADAAAAVFLMAHLSSYRGRGSPAVALPPLSFGVYTCTAAAAEMVSEALFMPGTAQGVPPPEPTAVRVWKESLEDMGSETSFAAATNVSSVAYTNLEEAECETDVGVVCLSGLLDVVTAGLKGNPAGHRPDVRQQQWRQLWAEAADGSPSLFVTRLQWWLWRLLRRVRLGVFFIGSRELFTCVPMFAKVEAFVRLQRRLLSPKDDRAYWLPAEVGACVLALVCPDHYKCRRTATVQERDLGAMEAEADGGEELAVEVQTRGAETCVSLCLRPYDGCPNPSHACLQPCHAQRRTDATLNDHHLSHFASKSADADAEAANLALHASCPYPCGNVLSCGHICHRICGRSCEPCAYVGLTQLTCGQRVVSGVENKVVQYTVFPHFQERRCGEATAPCQTPVSVPCTRCGSRTMLLCHQVTAQHERRRNAAAEAQAGHSSGGGEGEEQSAKGDDAYVIGETACAGCVALYNKVATKFGYDLLPLPPTDLTVGKTAERQAAATAEEDEEVDEEESNTPGSPLPRHTLSIEAQTELRREFATASKKVELLVMKEALEISSGRATDKTDYAVFRAKYEALKATQAGQERAWRDAYRAEMETCAGRLRKALETQYAVNAELDTMMPRLVSDATDEAEAQREPFIA